LLKAFVSLLTNMNVDQLYLKLTLFMSYERLEDVVILERKYDKMGIFVRILQDVKPLIQDLDGGLCPVLKIRRLEDTSFYSDRLPITLTYNKTNGEATEEIDLVERDIKISTDDVDSQVSDLLESEGEFEASTEFENQAATEFEHLAGTEFENMAPTDNNIEKKKIGVNPKYRCRYCHFETENSKERVLHKRNCFEKKKFKMREKYRRRFKNGNRKYQCKSCNQTYTILKFFKRHKCPTKPMTLLIPKFYPCSICEEEFLTRVDYDNHRQLQHGYTQSILAEKRIDSKVKTWREACEAETGNFKCRFCDFRSEFRVEIFNHLKDCQAKKDRVMHCPNCNYTTLYSLFMYQHKCIMRNKNTKKAKFYNCRECKVSFPFKDEWDVHMQESHGKESTLAKRYFLNRIVRKRNQFYDFECPSCDFKSSNKVEVFQHYQNHKKRERKFPCTICPNKIFTGSHHLKHHIKTVHENVRIVQCELCDKAFHTKQMYQRHYRGVHLGLTHPCPECNCRYSQRPDLKRHIRKSHPFFEDWDSIKAVSKTENFSKNEKFMFNATV